MGIAARTGISARNSSGIANATASNVGRRASTPMAASETVHHEPGQRAKRDRAQRDQRDQPSRCREAGGYKSNDYQRGCHQHADNQQRNLPGSGLWRAAWRG